MIENIIHKNEPNQMKPRGTQSDLDRLLGVTRSKLEKAFIQDNIPRLKTKRGGIVLDAENLDVEKYGDLFDGYNDLGKGIAIIPAHSIR